jgi:hypothetical protein
MRGLRLGILLGAAVAALSTASACGGGGTGGSAASTGSTGGGATASGTGAATTSTSATTGTGGATTTTSTSATTGTGGATTSSTGAGGDAGPAHGKCTKPCALPADCCPAGDPACPGPNYPYNYECKGGACYNPQCSITDDCTAQNPKQDCYSLDGFKTCLFACVTDGDCNAPLTCAGKDDNGKSYCIFTGGTGCTDDASCVGLGKCIDKVCVCDVDADCTHQTFNKCAK